MILNINFGNFPKILNFIIFKRRIHTYVNKKEKANRQYTCSSLQKVYVYENTHDLL